MVELKKISFGKHGTILVQALQTDTDDDFTKVGLGSETLKSASDEIFQTAISICSDLAEKLNHLDKRHAPEKCELSFGIQINTGGKAFIVHASSQANFKITFGWDKKGE